MAKFKKYNYKQDAMLVINFEEQLQPGTFEHAVHYLIDNKIELLPFYPKFKNDDTGRPAYDPAILLKIILFAYSKGITSSREEISEESGFPYQSLINLYLRDCATQDRKIDIQWHKVYYHLMLKILAFLRVQNKALAVQEVE